MEHGLDTLKSFIFGTLFISLIEIVAPDGNFKKYFHFVGGLILMCIVVGNLTSFTYLKEGNFPKGKSEVDILSQTGSNFSTERVSKSLMDTQQQAYDKVYQYVQKNYGLDTNQIKSKSDEEVKK